MKCAVACRPQSLYATSTAQRCSEIAAEVSLHRSMLVVFFFFFSFFFFFVLMTWSCPER